MTQRKKDRGTDNVGSALRLTQPTLRPLNLANSRPSMTTRPEAMTSAPTTWLAVSVSPRISVPSAATRSSTRVSGGTSGRAMAMKKNVAPQSTERNTSRSQSVARMGQPKDGEAA